MQPGYVHKQRGILRPILLAAAAVSLIVAFVSSSVPPRAVIAASTAAACVVLSFAFSYLAVEDKGGHLRICFGPLRIFKKNIPYDSIVGIGQGRSHFLSGWGIHPTPSGRLWNIGGRDYVRLEMKQGANILIGTDDIDGLTEFLLSKTVAGDSKDLK